MPTAQSPQPGAPWVLGLLVLTALPLSVPQAGGAPPSAPAQDGVVITTEGQPKVRLVSVDPVRTSVGRFERCELTLRLDGPVANPFDPDEIAVDAVFQLPRGKPVIVPGFYSQPFERSVDGHAQQEVLRPAGEPLWRVRFAPDQVGHWTYHIRVTTPHGVQTWSAGAVEVGASPHRGFVRLDPQRGAFRFDSGEPFVPIGENLAWGPNVRLLPAYEQWFRELHAQRANYIRVWMAPWCFRLETKETKVGRYDQLRAWQLDTLLDQSQQYGIYWQLCLLNHGSFSRNQDPEWQSNPYNAQWGGPCRAPGDFMTNPAAMAQYRKLLRYVVARWGDHPQLATWELFNEPDLSDIPLESIPPWVAQISQYLRDLDSNRRPITISFHHASPEAVWRLPTVDMIQLHVYDHRDFAALFAGSLISDAQRYRKPVMIGEFGWISDLVRKIDRPGIHLHDGLWSSMMNGSAGAAMIWYWDEYVHPNHLERHFGPLAKFWAGESLGHALRPVQFALSDEDVAGQGLGSRERVYLWLKNRTHNVDQYLAYRCELAKQRLRQARGQAPQAVQYPARIVQGATAVVSGERLSGRYRVEWWDPYRGEIIGTNIGRARRGKLTLRVPALTYDLAVKLVRMRWWETG